MQETSSLSHISRLRASSAMFWNIVDEIVSSKEGKLIKYPFFERLWNEIFNEKLVIFQAPTASGKTDAILAPYIAQALEYSEWIYPHLIYVLPTRSLVHRMYFRIKETINLFSKKLKDKIVVTYDYGELRVDKPYLEGDIVVTTYDTLFYTMYGFRSRGYHRTLPLGIIASSIIVLDEVQLLQDSYWYSLDLIPLHVANLFFLGAKVIVMGATIPTVLINRMKESINRMKLISKDDIVKVYGETSVRGKLKVNISDKHIIEGIKELNLEDLEKPILIVCNTISNAVEMYKSISRKVNNVELLHSRLKLYVRKLREEFKDLDVLVSTQVIEAGLDYDFRTIITEISPIDSLIQRLGRGGRRKNAEAWIFYKVEEAYKVYPKEIIDKTVELLDSINLSLSVENENIALKLVDNVYTDRTINNLIKNVDIKVLNKVRYFLSRFLNKGIFLRKDIVDMSHYLVRLGVEIKCIVPEQDLYRKIIESDSVDKEIILKLIDKNSLSISYDPVRKTKHIKLLTHKINGSEKYIIVVFKKKNGKSIFEVLKLTSLSDVINYMQKRSSEAVYAIVNPDFYEYYNGYDLGVVRFW